MSKKRQNNRFGIKPRGSGVVGELSVAMAYEILGLMVRTAIIDWVDYRRNQDNSRYLKDHHIGINSARHFLFSDEGLDLWILRFDIPLNISHVREYAETASRGIGNGCIEDYFRLGDLWKEIEKIK